MNNNLGLISKKILGAINRCLDLEENVDSSIMNGKIVLPYWKISIEVEVVKADTKSISGMFIISSNEWDREIVDEFETKGNSLNELVEKTTNNFMYGLLSPIVEYEKGNIYSEEDTQYGDTFHLWEVYCGNILVTGQPIKTSKRQDDYWNMIKDKVFKRIGNQKMCYVSIYAECDDEGKRFAECFINNVFIKELSNIIKRKIITWNNSEFTSIKQNILIIQQDDTYMEYDYDQYLIGEYVKDAMMLFEKYNIKWLSGKHDKYWFDRYYDELYDRIGDNDLVWEIVSLIPEICSYSAFDDIDYYDGIVLYVDDEKNVMYETQLASYVYIRNAIFDVLNSGVLKNTDKTYQAYVDMSSTTKAVMDMLKKGCKYKDIVIKGPIMFAPEDYTIR